MAIGEAGSITTNSPGENDPITVTLTEPLTNPVFALSATNNGGNQFVLRITDQTLDADGNTTAFTFIIEEWEFLDGPHPAFETINWLAIEEGVHTLPDGRIIEAGTVSADNTNSSVSLAGGFADPPVVLTSVMSENDTTTVDSDPLNITASGFNVRLQEEENEDGAHANETVGWIAIQAGGDGSSGTANAFGGVDENTDVLGLGATYTNGVVLAETQTINGGDTATVVIDSQTATTVGVFIEEETSQDAETGHVNETVGIVAFEDGLIACFSRGTRITTDNGDVPVEALTSRDAIKVFGPKAKKAPVLHVMQRDFAASELARNPQLYPVRIKAGALGSDLPARDLLVSRQHRMLVASQVATRMFGTSQVLIPAIKLTTLPGIFVDETVNSITYFHLLLDTHHVIYAENAPTESLHLGTEALRAMTPQARDEIAAIFPGILNDCFRPDRARNIPTCRRQKRLVQRLRKNRKLVLEPQLLAVSQT